MFYVCCYWDLLPIFFGRVHVVGAAFAELFVEGILVVLEFDRAPMGGKLVGQRLAITENRSDPTRARIYCISHGQCRSNSLGLGL